MNLQVNLLRKNEQRYQGIVSTKVLIVGLLAIVVAIVLLFLTVAAIINVTVQAQRDRLSLKWEQQGPVADDLRARAAATAENRQTAGRLEKWSGSSVAPAYEILRKIQESVPDSMQLTWLHFAMGGADGTKLQMNGRAEGSGGELLAVEFKRNLNKCEPVRNFCGDVRLISSIRDGEDGWIFSLEGARSVKGGAQ